MLGRFRLSKNASKQRRDQSRALHCTLCVAMRETGGRRLSLALSYEAEWLLLLGLAMRGPLPERRRDSTCTGIPLLPVYRLQAPPELLEQAVHLSVWLAACMLADHRIDGDRRGAADLLGDFAIRDALGPALAALGITADSPLHPERLAAQQQNAASIEDYLAAERQRIGAAWCNAIARVAPKTAISPALLDWAAQLGGYLSDLLILEDAIEDRDRDLARNLPNPLRTDDDLLRGRSLLASTMFAAVTCLRNAPVALDPNGLSLLTALLTQTEEGDDL
jgi:hypothetical protein